MYPCFQVEGSSNLCWRVTKLHKDVGTATSKWGHRWPLSNWPAQSLHVAMFSSRWLYHYLQKSYCTDKVPQRYGHCDLKMRALVTVIKLDQCNHYMYLRFQLEDSIMICWRVIAFTRFHEDEGAVTSKWGHWWPLSNLTSAITICTYVFK